MKKCDCCGRRFRLLAKNRYEIIKSPVGFDRLTEGITYYNAFDCPHCGCQNIVGVIEKVKPMEVKAHPINDDISKGFEEFTKMMFKQGQGESEDL